MRYCSSQRDPLRVCLQSASLKLPNEDRSGSSVSPPFLPAFGLALALALGGGGPLGCARDESNLRAGQVPTTAGPAAVGALAPDFAARDIEGRSVKLSDHFGKQVVLLDFCSTWCEPCVAEFPHLRTLYEARKAQGFTIVAISVDGPQTAANVPGFARRNQLNFPMVIDEDSRIASLYNPKKTAPLTVLIDRNGKIVAMHEGYTPGDEERLAQEVSDALQGATAVARPLARP